MKQTEIILNHLQKYKSITSWESFELYGATRLSAIIFNLKKLGYKFDEEWIKTNNRFGQPVQFKKYILKEEE